MRDCGGAPCLEVRALAVPVLERLKSEVTYRFEKTDGGGKVRIATKNAEALKGLHEFLRFQISGHQTGDSPAVQQER